MAALAIIACFAFGLLFSTSHVAARRSSAATSPGVSLRGLLEVGRGSYFIAGFGVELPQAEERASVV